MLAFGNGALKKVMASSEMCWHSQKELLKSVGKFRNVSAFAKGAVKKRVGKFRHGLSFP